MAMATKPIEAISIFASAATFHCPLLSLFCIKKPWVKNSFFLPEHFHAAGEKGKSQSWWGQFGWNRFL